MADETTEVLAPEETVVVLAPPGKHRPEEVIREGSRDGIAHYASDDRKVHRFVRFSAGKPVVGVEVVAGRAWRGQQSAYVDQVYLVPGKGTQAHLRDLLAYARGVFRRLLDQPTKDAPLGDLSLKRTMGQPEEASEAIVAEDYPTVRRAMDIQAFLSPRFESGQSALVAIRVPDEIAREWPEAVQVEGGPPHYSLAYIPGPFDEEGRLLLLDVLSQIARTVRPFEVEMTQGVSDFPITSRNMKVLHKGADPRSERIMKTLAERIKEALAAHGIRTAEYGSFIAHATLQVSPADEAYEGPSPEGSFTVDQLELWGWRDSYTIPLGTGASQQQKRQSSIRVEADERVPDAALKVEMETAAPPFAKPMFNKLPDVDPEVIGYQEFKKVVQQYAGIVTFKLVDTRSDDELALVGLDTYTLRNERFVRVSFAEAIVKGFGYGRALYDHILEWCKTHDAWFAPDPNAVSEAAMRIWREMARDFRLSRRRRTDVDSIRMNEALEATTDLQSGEQERWTPSNAPYAFYEYKIARRESERTGSIRVTANGPAYVVNEAWVRRYLSNHAEPEVAVEEAATLGAVSRVELREVPLTEIHDEGIDYPQRLARAREALQQHIPLRPVELHSKNGKPPYFIEDGRHRVEAARQLGLTHVPALVRWYEPVAPERTAAFLRWAQQASPELIIHSDKVVETLNFPAACQLYSLEAVTDTGEPAPWRNNWCGGRSADHFANYAGRGRRRFIVAPDGPTDTKRLRLANGTEVDVPVAAKVFTISVDASSGAVHNINDAANRYYTRDSNFDLRGAADALKALREVMPNVTWYGETVATQDWTGVPFPQIWAQKHITPDQARSWLRTPLWAKAVAQAMDDYGAVIDDSVREFLRFNAAFIREGKDPQLVYDWTYTPGISDENARAAIEANFRVQEVARWLQKDLDYVKDYPYVDSVKNIAIFEGASRRPSDLRLKLYIALKSAGLKPEDLRLCYELTELGVFRMNQADVLSATIAGLTKTAKILQSLGLSPNQLDEKLSAIEFTKTYGSGASTTRALNWVRDDLSNRPSWLVQFLSTRPEGDVESGPLLRLLMHMIPKGESPQRWFDVLNEFGLMGADAHWTDAISRCLNSEHDVSTAAELRRALLALGYQSKGGVTRPSRLQHLLDAAGVVDGELNGEPVPEFENMADLVAWLRERGALNKRTAAILAEMRREAAVEWDEDIEEDKDTEEHDPRDYMDFRGGDCGALAVALADAYGLLLVGLYFNGELHHAAAASPEGNHVLDCDGWHDAEARRVQFHGGEVASWKPISVQDLIAGGLTDLSHYDEAELEYIYDTVDELGAHEKLAVARAWLGQERRASAKAPSKWLTSEYDRFIYEFQKRSMAEELTAEELDEVEALIARFFAGETEPLIAWAQSVLPGSFKARPAFDPKTLSSQFDVPEEWQPLTDIPLYHGSRDAESLLHEGLRAPQAEYASADPEYGFDAVWREELWAEFKSLDPALKKRIAAVANEGRPIRKGDIGQAFSLFWATRNLKEAESYGDVVEVDPAQLRYFFSFIDPVAGKGALVFVMPTDGVQAPPSAFKRVSTSRRADLMPGGQGDDMPDEAFEGDELERGVETEMREHGLDEERATEVAKDHLAEDPRYYSKHEGSLRVTASVRVTPSVRVTSPAKVAQMATKPKKRWDLVALHNLSVGNLRYALKDGGLIAPSIAITRPDIPFTSFGDITLLAPMSMVDPQRTPVFDADIYSPRYPTVKHKVDTRKLYKLRDEYADYLKQTGSQWGGIESDLADIGGIEKIVQSSWYSPALMLAFLEREKGVLVEPIMRDQHVQYEWVKSPILDEFFKTHGSPDKATGDYAYDAPEVSNYYRSLAEACKQAIVDYWTRTLTDETPESLELRQDMIDTGLKKLNRNTTDDGLNRNIAGNVYRSYEAVGKTELDTRAFEAKVKEAVAPHREEFEAWVERTFEPVRGDRYIPRGQRKMRYTPENVLKEMTRELKGGEGFNYGVGSIRAKGAKRFRTMDSMLSAGDRLVSEEEMEGVKSELNDRFFALVEELRPYHRAGDEFGFADIVSEVLMQGYKRGGSITRALSESYFNTASIPADVIRDLYAFSSELVQAPTQYFEAKPQRMVQLAEFIGAVVPSKLDPALVEALSRRFSLEVEVYEDESDRQAALGRLIAKTGTRQASIRVSAALRIEASEKKVEFLKKQNPKASQVIDILAKADPTAPRYEYLQAMVEARKRGSDVDDIINYMRIYHNSKPFAEEMKMVVDAYPGVYSVSGSLAEFFGKAGPTLRYYLTEFSHEVELRRRVIDHRSSFKRADQIGGLVSRTSGDSALGAYTTRELKRTILRREVPEFDVDWLEAPLHYEIEYGSDRRENENKIKQAILLVAHNSKVLAENRKIVEQRERVRYLANLPPDDPRYSLSYEADLRELAAIPEIRTLADLREVANKDLDSSKAEEGRVKISSQVTEFTTWEAARAFCTDTEWCWAYPASNEYFRSYNENNKLYRVDFPDDDKSPYGVAISRSSGRIAETKDRFDRPLTKEAQEKVKKALKGQGLINTAKSEDPMDDWLEEGFSEYDYKSLTKLGVDLELALELKNHGFALEHEVGFNIVDAAKVYKNALSTAEEVGRPGPSVEALADVLLKHKEVYIRIRTSPDTALYFIEAGASGLTDAHVELLKDVFFNNEHIYALNRNREQTGAFYAAVVKKFEKELTQLLSLNEVYGSSAFVESPRDPFYDYVVGVIDGSVQPEACIDLLARFKREGIPEESRSSLGGVNQLIFQHWLNMGVPPQVVASFLKTAVHAWRPLLMYQSYEEALDIVRVLLSKGDTLVATMVQHRLFIPTLVGLSGEFSRGQIDEIARFIASNANDLRRSQRVYGEDFDSLFSGYSVGSRFSLSPSGLMHTAIAWLPYVEGLVIKPHEAVYKAINGQMPDAPLEAYMEGYEVTEDPYADTQGYVEPRNASLRVQAGTSRGVDRGYGARAFRSSIMA